MTEELRDFADQAADLLYPTGAPVQYAPDADDDDADDADDELESGAEEAGDEETGDLTPAEYETLSTEFWRSLSDEDSAAAERSPAIRDALWRGYVAGLQSDDAGADDEPVSGFDVLTFAIENPEDLVDGTGARISAAEWIAGWVDANPRDWVEACVEAGWPANTRQPSHADVKALGRGAQTAVLAVSFEEMMEKDRAAGRRW